MCITILCTQSVVQYMWLHGLKKSLNKENLILYFLFQKACHIYFLNVLMKI